MSTRLSELTLPSETSLETSQTEKLEKLEKKEIVEKAEKSENEGKEEDLESKPSHQTIQINKQISQRNDIYQSTQSDRSIGLSEHTKLNESKEAEKPSQSMQSIHSLQSLISFKQERCYLFPDIADYRFVDYASVYFQRKKTFFRNASVEPLCCYSAKPLLHPLHPVNRMHLADILGFEHSILTIQGVLPDAKNQRQTALYGLLSNADIQKLNSVIQGLIRFPDLTDEIFAFFIRQTNECTDARAESKAFEALFVLSQYCRPSDQLLPYLVAHLQKRCHSDDEVEMESEFNAERRDCALHDRGTP